MPASPSGQSNFFKGRLGNNGVLRVEYIRDEGDRWMLLGDKPLIFKVDPVSTGSDTLVVGTEEMPSGNRIPTHKHLDEDEAIFVHKNCKNVANCAQNHCRKATGEADHTHALWGSPTMPALITTEVFCRGFA